jgi:hypothetical protein
MALTRRWPLEASLSFALAEEETRHDLIHLLLGQKLSEKEVAGAAADQAESVNPADRIVEDEGGQVGTAPFACRIARNPPSLPRRVGTGARNLHLPLGADRFRGYTRLGVGGCGEEAHGNVTYGPLARSTREVTFTTGNSRTISSPLAHSLIRFLPLDQISNRSGVAVDHANW